MSNDPREELLSAYLDNELSADERAQVEQWLSENAEYRQLYEELRALSHDLHSLPRHELADDLGPLVLRRTERAVLSEPRSGGASAPESGASEFGATASWARGRSKRLFIWPALAVAAALLVALFDSQRDERDVALHDGRIDAAAEKSKSATDSYDLQSVPSMRARDAQSELDSEPQNGATESLSESRRSASERQEGDLRLERSAAGAADAAAPQLEQMPPTDRGAVPGAAPTARSAKESAPAEAAPQTVDFFAKPPAGEPLEKLQLDKNVRRALANREQVSVIQCDVSPGYINENQIEKVLASNKLQYRRYYLPQAIDQKDAPVQAPAPLAANALPAGVQYSVDATPDQVEQIVTELEQQQNRGSVTNLSLGLQVRSGPLKSAAPAAEKRAGIATVKQQPVTIYLYSADLKQQSQRVPGEPAAPAAAPAEP
ncbi:MAG: anti-sigma factor [Pirellulales bacterium]